MRRLGLALYSGRAALWLGASCTGSPVGGSPSLAGSVVGRELQLPARDAFGRDLPKGALRVVTLACGGCMDLAGYLASASAGRPVVFASTDPDAAVSHAEVGRTVGACL